jgi:hypothetical protein
MLSVYGSTYNVINYYSRLEKCRGQFYDLSRNKVTSFRLIKREANNESTQW